MQQVQILDRQGRERDWQWLAAQFGKVRLERVPLDRKAYRLVKLREAEGPAVLLVHVEDAQGEPLAGIPVVRSWPGAPELPAWPQPTSRWLDRGALGPTDSNGALAFGMGALDVYATPGSGPSAAWVADPAGPSDYISGLGVLATTNHRHLDLCFQFVEPQPQPEPARLPGKTSARAAQGPGRTAGRIEVEPLLAAAAAALSQPSNEQWDLFIERLDEIIDALERRASAQS